MFWNSSDISLDLGKLHNQIQTLEHSRLDFTTSGEANDFFHTFSNFISGKTILVTVNNHAMKLGVQTSMFIATLFTIAKAWKQPKCPSAEEWIKKMWYMYTLECYSAIKKKDCFILQGIPKEFAAAVTSPLLQSQHPWPAFTSLNPFTLTTVM